MDVHKASETASLIVGAILTVLVQQGYIPSDIANTVQSIAGGLIAYAAARIYHKLANGQTPFRPVRAAVVPIPTPSNQGGK